MRQFPYHLNYTYERAQWCNKNLDTNNFRQCDGLWGSEVDRTIVNRIKGHKGNYYPRNERNIIQFTNEQDAMMCKLSTTEAK